MNNVANTTSIEELERALQNPYWDTRLEAVKALASSSNPRAVDLLITVLDDPSSEVRLEAVHALGKLGDRKAVQPLSEKFDRAHGEQAQAIFEALEVLDPQSAERAKSRQKKQERGDNIRERVKKSFFLILGGIGGLILVGFLSLIVSIVSRRTIGFMVEYNYLGPLCYFPFFCLVGVGVALLGLQGFRWILNRLG